MNAADLTEAAAMLDAAGPVWPRPQAEGRAFALLEFLGLLEADKTIGLNLSARRQFARLLRAASALDGVFPMRVPTARGAAFFGARATHRGGEGSLFAGEGKPKQTDYAGLGTSPASAFCACIGEAAEHDAMFLRRQDRRPSPQGSLTLLDLQLRPAGGIDASLILREAGEGRAPPRTSTGYAAGPTLGDAALSALLECAERHAVSLWFNGLRRPAPLLPEKELQSYLLALRGADAPKVHLMRLPHDIQGVVAAAAWSVSEAGCIAVGYGCARSQRQAAMKAARELCQGEFALYLEGQTPASGRGAFTARSEMFDRRRELFETEPDQGKSCSKAGGFAGLCAGFPGQVNFVDLTLEGDCVPVVCALADGLHDIAGEFSAGQTRPL